MYKRGYVLARAIEQNSDILMTNYKILRNKATRDKSNQKEKYYQGKICENQGNPKGMWKTLKGVHNHKGPEPMQNTLTPEIFNQYFTNIGIHNIVQGSLYLYAAIVPTLM